MPLFHTERLTFLTCHNISLLVIPKVKHRFRVNFTGMCTLVLSFECVEAQSESAGKTRYPAVLSGPHSKSTPRKRSLHNRSDNSSVYPNFRRSSDGRGASLLLAFVLQNHNQALNLRKSLSCGKGNILCFQAFPSGGGSSTWVATCAGKLWTLSAPP
jgi:hypothetical protein